MPLDQPPPPAEIVVQAARLPDAAGDPAFSIIKIDPEVLSNADRLDDALETAPGFSPLSPHLQPRRQSDHAGRIPARHRRIGSQPGAGDAGRHPPKRSFRRLGDLDRPSARGGVERHRRAGFWVGPVWRGAR